MTSATTIDTAAILATARRARAEANAAEARVFVAALEWASAHEVTDPDDAATWGDTPVPLAGPGAPLVSEFCLAEFATAVGVSTDSGRNLIAHALEIAHRLPRIWQRIQIGDLPVWRGRRIAEHTIALSAEAAAYVDTQVAGFAHKIGYTATQRLVDEAIGRFMPALAEEKRERAAENRYFTVEPANEAFTGTTHIHGTLDLADALDLETAVRAGAETLKTAGSADTLDVRRAAALGSLARGQADLGLATARRDLTLYLHLAPDTDVAELEGHGLLTKTQIATWCGLPDTKITIKPVIDLVSTSSTDESLGTDAYTVPDRIREHVLLRERTCIFPWCTRPARRCDLDHAKPYDPDGPPGQTATEKLAPLCRRHHRLKTHPIAAGSTTGRRWTYTILEPGSYLWSSPHGYAYLRDQTGTRDLTPRPVDPPG